MRPLIIAWTSVPLATGDLDGDVKVPFSKVNYLSNLIALDMDSLPKQY